ETATIEAPPPPHRPTRAEIDEVQRQIDGLLGQFSGSYRARCRSRREQVHRDLMEALRYDDEPKAIQRMAELRELLQELESRPGRASPNWCATASTSPPRSPTPPGATVTSCSSTSMPRSATPSRRMGSRTRPSTGSAARTSKNTPAT